MGGPEPLRLEVDRFEGDLAVVRTDGGRFLDLPRWILPAGTGEGDVVVVRRVVEGEAARVELTVDRAAGAAARAEAEGVLDRLRARDPGGDIRL